MTRAELRQEWEARVAAYKASGQSVPAWCAALDVKPHQLRYWIRKLDPAQTAVKSSAMWLTMEVDQRSTESESGLFIRVGQATIEVKPGFDQALLADVVRTLAGLC